MAEENETRMKDQLYNLFSGNFKKNQVLPSDSFDQAVFFLKNDQDYYKNLTNIKYFSDLHNSNPAEGDDLIKLLMIKSLIKSRQSKIKASIFLEELVQSIVKLRDERKRIEILIKKYDAYKTKNIIEEYLNNYDNSVNLNESMKSNIKLYISKIEGLSKGEYKLALMAAGVNNKSCFEEIVEEIFDYKLNHIIQVRGQDDKVLFFDDKGSEYFFPEIELFSYELSAKEKASSIVNYESGTNILYFFIKIENLNKNYEDVVVTERKPLLELFLNNLKPLIDNFSLTKSFYTEFGVGLEFFKSVVLKLKIVIEFDPITLATVYSKIVSLLKNIISFKVHIDHKWKTIFKYFPELERNITEILNDFSDKKADEKGICTSF